MKYLSTFSGIGGFELGIQQAYEKRKNTYPTRHIVNDNGNEHEQERSRPTCIGYSEIDRYASQIYQKHYPDQKNYGDITKIDTATLPDFDLLVGGFPCQSFSVAGKRKGFEDTRGTLFFELARILRDKRPRYFIFENVKGLLSHDGGKTFSTILEVLTDIGYEHQWQLLNSKDFGVPQNRERIYIVGHLRGEPRPKVFPIGGADEVHSQSNEAQKEVHAGTLTARYPASWNGNYINNVEAVRRLTPVECERLQAFPEIRKTINFELCLDPQKSPANVDSQSPKLQKHVLSAEKKDQQVDVRYAITNTSTSSQQDGKHAAANVHIYCGESKIQIYSQGKLILSVNGAESQSWCHPYISTEDFALICAGINTILEKEIRHGGGGLLQSEQCSIHQQNGNLRVKLFGKEIMQLVDIAEKDLTTHKKHLKFIISNHSDIKHFALRLITLFSYVIHAIIGYIPNITLNQNTLTISLETIFGWTKYGVSEKGGTVEISDAHRYKCLGNAVTVNVVEAIAQRILELL